MKYRPEGVQGNSNKQQHYIPPGMKDAKPEPQVKKFKPSEYNKVNPNATSTSMNMSRYSPVKSAASPRRVKRYEGNYVNDSYQYQRK